MADLVDSAGWWTKHKARLAYGRLKFGVRPRLRDYTDWYIRVARGMPPLEHQGGYGDLPMFAHHVKSLKPQDIQPVKVEDF